MSIEKTNIEATASHSQEKREKRKKEVAHARRVARTTKIIGVVVLLAVIALFGWGIASIIIKQGDVVTASSDYSLGLDENGYISGVKASANVELPQYKGIEVPYAEIEYTEDEIDADVANVISSHKYVSDEAGLTVKDGDMVNIDYVGTIDGVEFEGGTAQGYDLTIGSGTFIDDYEQQLIDAENLSTVEVNVTFPEEYSNADIAGKDATFMVTINGIYVEPEFTDEFVAENLSDMGATVAEYRQAVRDENEKDRLKTYLETYLNDNTTVKSYPKKYVKGLKSIQKYDEMQSYEYMNQMYQSYLGYSMYNTFEEYVGKSIEEYDKSLKETAANICKENMIYQAIVELENATADSAYYIDYLEKSGQGGSAYYESLKTTSGEPFVLQQAIHQKAIEIVADSAVIKK